MFSALKKLVGSEPGQLRDKNIPAGLQSMNQSLQRRFAKGVQYNMKIVIRGDRNTGKSTLWHRLQGKKFLEEYIPTQEIQVTSIHWNYKTTDDVVKVEVWDVVDKGHKFPHPDGPGKSKKRGEGLKLENEPQEAESEMALDAEFLDVYKNCNGVIMMFDITKQWTFNYILRELPKVPNHVPVCVLGNHRDMGEHRVILPDDIRDFIAGLNRPLGSSYIHYAESSMKNGFGLKYLHRFFNIPFLQLQRETLLRQLETNQLDIDATLEELTVQQETEDQNYDIFLEMMETRNRGYSSPVPANGQSPSSGSQSPIVPASGASTGSSSPGTPQPVAPSQATLSLAPSPSPPPSSAPPPPPPPPPTVPAEEPAPAVAASTPVAPTPQKRGIIARLFGGSSTPEVANSAKPDSQVASASEAPAKVRSVDDFVPDDGLDSSFLEESSTPQKAGQMRPAKAAHDSDSEMEGNPMVAGLQDDLDPDDKVLLKGKVQTPVPSKDITLSSDEEGPAKSGVAILEDEDFDISGSGSWSSRNSSKPQSHTKFKGAELKPATVALVAPMRPEKVDSLKTTTSSIQTPALNPLPANTLNPPAKVKGKAEEVVSSDSDLEGPVAKQILSFVMDDPDFDSDEPGQETTKAAFPVRDDIPDLSDDEFMPSKMLEPLKPTVLSFKPKNDLDLFGLGFDETSPKNKDSSDEAEDKESKHSSKDKKKKKKKSKEEEEKAGKKKHKHKKKEKDEVTTSAGEDRKKKKSRSRKAEQLGDLEAFLSGSGDGLGKGGGSGGGGDYEEL
ncbi:rab-like protein 6 isoform X1 [Erpetoichthys calabaricus]|uniref:rab-like protein 6 isoform X1 n=1 Tax=Erpetoichthys calabaricus TaxID=27687 RepID=UPI0022349274|nr:rab-like protein 6 isoform X1 [Erpetoichthys calabaricus]XP_051788251.1 rab-like protein 6 isoform X1 [Erpetoichthys calabaricus]